MAMTNDMSVLSLGAVMPVSRKDEVSPGKGLQGRVADPTSSDERSAPASAPTEKRPDRGELEQSVQDLNSLVQELQRELRFSVDDNSGDTIVKVIDRHTDEVVRQIPSEEILQLRERLEAATGALFKGEA
jgi:flagellar protein FlaG